ncbi:MAG: poly-gamma-glutamate hydrolase family protein, partial [Acidimicrobiia bacterium]
ASFGFMALHGGSLERATAEVARRAADRAGASLYTVEQPEDLQWHIPSHRYDPGAAPRLAAFLAHVEVVVSVHGYGREGWWTRLLVGGANRALGAHAATVLREHLEGFEVVDAIDQIPRELRGLHPDNPVNRTARGGVQLELPPRVRGLGPNGRDEYVDALVDGLATVFA